MNKLSFNRDWTLMDLNGGFADPRSSRRVDLPYDMSLAKPRVPDAPGGGAFGYFQGATGIFQKRFVPEPEWKGKYIAVAFEAVYKDAAVYLNGLLLYRHPYGYTGFTVNLTPHLLWDQENTLSVQVYNSDQPNTRWYSGSGITRPVWLCVAPAVHIAPDGIFVKPTDITPAGCRLELEVKAEGFSENAPCILTCQVLDPDGKEVLTDCREMSAPVSRFGLALAAPRLWSPENPQLYTLRTSLSCNGEADVVETPFGIRSISVSPDHGLQLNGKTIKLRGGCLHSENGILGARSFAHGEEWKVRRMLENGYNAVRCAHNPPAKAFLDACDRLGMLVIDEAFDVWQDSKNIADYGRYFMEWWQRDLSAMLCRDRNHPSVIMWSTGNEVKELLGTGDGFARSAELARFVKSLDDSRPVTNALQEVYLGPTAEKVPAFDLLVPDDKWQAHSEAFSKELDVVGYNYSRYHYETDGKVFPNRVICGEESHPLRAYENWRDVENFPYVLGDFVWTAIDYLGEAGSGFTSYHNTVEGMDGMMQMFGAKYPYHLATTGDLDLCGHKRPQSYYRDCVWQLTQTPFIGVYDPKYYGKPYEMSCWGWHPVEDSWTWPGQEGTTTVVDVYSVGDEVALYVNDRLVDRRPAGQTDMQYLFRFDPVPFRSGSITAVAWQNGREIGRHNLYTAVAPAVLALSCDRDALPGVYGETAYIDIMLLDENGVRVTRVDDQITVSVTGPARLIALGSADPESEESYMTDHRCSYHGRLQAVICATGGSGPVNVCAQYPGLRNTITLSAE